MGLLSWWHWFGWWPTVGESCSTAQPTPPGISTARASHHTTSHDLAPQSLATWHQHRGGWSSPANSSKILPGVFESSLCAHRAPGQPCQWLEFSVPEQRANTSFKASPSKTVPTQVPSLSERFNAKSFADRVFHREHFYLCHQKSQQIKLFISNTSQVLFPLAGCMLIPCILWICKITPALRHIKIHYNKYFNSNILKQYLGSALFS